MNDVLRQLVQYLNQLGQPDPQIAQQVAQAQRVPSDTRPAGAPGASVQNLRELQPGQDDTPAHSEEWNRGMPGGGAVSSEVQPLDLLSGVGAAEGALVKATGRAVGREGAKRGAAAFGRAATNEGMPQAAYDAATQALKDMLLDSEGVAAHYGTHSQRVAQVASKVAADQAAETASRAEVTGVGRAAAKAQRYSPELTEELLKHLADAAGAK